VYLAFCFNFDFMKCCIIPLLLIFSCTLFSQVSIDPVFPNVNSVITVYFDATQGNEGLKDCNCTVYAHAGLITDKSTSGSDWKYVQGNWGTDDPKVKMTKVGDNLYALTYKIKDFYGIPDGEKIRQLAFVFRNVNGSKEGKTATGGDIFYNFPDPDAGLQYIVVKPAMESRVVPINTQLNLELYTSKSAAIQFKVNDSTYVDTFDSSVVQQFTIDKFGTYRFELNIQSGNEVIDTAFTWAVGDSPAKKEIPAGMKLGFNFDEGKGLVVLEAPGRDIGFLVGNFSNWQPDTDYQMNQTPDGQFLWARVDTAGLAGLLDYQIWFDDGLKIPDPLSVEILDDRNDKYIEQSTYPDLPPYPVGKTNGLVSHLDFTRHYSWDNKNFIKPQKGDLVIYELLLRDFLNSHDYNDLKDTLAYLKRLGVNAIELMPVSEFEGNISWGYNVSLHHAIDKYYGGPLKLKSFIDAAHGLGIAVIADVVFNHAFGQNPMVQMYWDDVLKKPAANNPWFNQDARHPFSVGYDFNHESPSTKRYVNQILKDWLEEYRFDGYRFDLSKGFTQTNNPNDVGKWGQYDASRIAILKGYAQQIRSVSPDAFIILEHFAENKEEKELSDNGMMLWGNLSYAYAENVKCDAANLDWGYYKQRGWTQPNLVTYMESHDEERMVYRAKTEGKSSTLGYNIRDEATALSRAGMAAAFFYTIPGPKMLWQFGELGYDYSINTCPNGTINNGCRTDPKPIRWDYFRQKERLKLYAVIAGLTHLKHTYPEIFNEGDAALDLDDLYKSIIIDRPELKVVIVGNFDVTDLSKAISFPTNEWYYNYLGNDSIQGTITPRQLTIKEGQYKVYLNKKVTNPASSLSTFKLNNESFQVYVYPNPAFRNLQIVLPDDVGGTKELILFDISGKKVDSLALHGDRQIVSFPLKQIDSGLYILKVIAGNKTGIAKVMIVD